MPLSKFPTPPSVILMIQWQEVVVVESAESTASNLARDRRQNSKPHLVMLMFIRELMIVSDNACNYKSGYY